MRADEGWPLIFLIKVLDTARWLLRCDLGRFLQLFRDARDRSGHYVFDRVRGETKELLDLVDHSMLLFLFDGR